MLLPHPDARIQECFMAEPISNCDISFDVEEPKYNSTVGLTLSFTAKAPTKAGDVIEIALPGFTTDLENTTNLKFEKEVTPFEDLSSIKAWYTEYEPFKDGCFQATQDDLL
jgi:hypothetical protein